MLFGASRRASEAVQAQLILAILLMAILPITIVNVPPPNHAITLRLWPLSDRSLPASGDTAAAVRISWPSDARRLASVKVSPEVPTDEPVSRIDVAAGDTILFEGRPVDLVGLRMELDWLSVREQFWLELRPHPESRHERVHEVLGVIGRAGPFYMRIDHRPFRSAIG